MLRRTLTILSFIGLLLSVGLWGVSYSDVFYYLQRRQTQHYFVGLGDGACRFFYVEMGPSSLVPGLHWSGYTNLNTEWKPDLDVEAGEVRLSVPLWMPTVVFGLLLASCRPLLFHRRRKRKKLGLCVKCGYNLKGLSEPRCPECNTPFDERLLRKNA